MKVNWAQKLSKSFFTLSVYQGLIFFAIESLYKYCKCLSSSYFLLNFAKTQQQTAFWYVQLVRYTQQVTKRSPTLFLSIKQNFSYFIQNPEALMRTECTLWKPLSKCTFRPPAIFYSLRSFPRTNYIQLCIYDWSMENTQQTFLNRNDITLNY